MGIPKPGVDGRGGDAGRVLRIEGKDAKDTGDVGRDTVIGIELVPPLSVKQLLRRQSKFKIKEKIIILRHRQVRLSIVSKAVS